VVTVPTFCSPDLRLGEGIGVSTAISSSPSSGMSGYSSANMSSSLGVDCPECAEREFGEEER